MARRPQNNPPSSMGFAAAQSTGISYAAASLPSVYNGDQPLTIVGLFYPVATNASGIHAFYSRISSAAAGLSFYWLDSVAGSALGVRNASTAGGGQPAREVNALLSPPIRETDRCWYNVACTYDGGVLASGIKLFYSPYGSPLTEAQAYSDTDGSGVANASSTIPVSIGYRAGDNDQFANFHLAYLWAWHRVLSGEEIRAVQLAGPVLYQEDLTLNLRSGFDYSQRSLKSTTNVLVPGGLSDSVIAFSPSPRTILVMPEDSIRAQPDSFQADAFGVFPIYSTSNIKTFSGLLRGSTKTFNGVTVSSGLKTWNGLQ